MSNYKPKHNSSTIVMAEECLFLGREPWSSGYGKRLKFQGCGFESQYRILDRHFSHTFVVKIVKMFV